VITFLAVIVICSPVCGFLPLLCFLLLTVHLPKPLIMTGEPEESSSFIISRRQSTISRLSFFWIPMLICKLSAMSIFVRGMIRLPFVALIGLIFYNLNIWIVQEVLHIMHQLIVSIPDSAVIQCIFESNGLVIRSDVIMFSEDNFN